ncbi:MAG: dienelactone hydrolase [Actinoallomurus sp.]|nr:dienelactone hydrolase [Actinoallomurus sp.]
MPRGLLLHGTSDIPDGAVAGGMPVQLHVADPDPFEPGDRLEEWQEGMRRAGATAELFRYRGPATGSPTRTCPTTTSMRRRPPGREP